MFKTPSNVIYCPKHSGRTSAKGAGICSDPEAAETFARRVKAAPERAVQAAARLRAGSTLVELAQEQDVTAPIISGLVWREARRQARGDEGKAQELYKSWIAESRRARRLRQESQKESPV